MENPQAAKRAKRILIAVAALKRSVETVAGDMPDMPDDPFDDESLCNRCGRCCFEKVRDEDGVVVFTDIPCPFLNVATMTCRVYPNRLKRQPRCSTARHSSTIGALPDDCPYVAHIPGYPMTATLAERPKLIPLVKQLFSRAGRRKKKKAKSGKSSSSS